MDIPSGSQLQTPDYGDQFEEREDGADNCIRKEDAAFPEPAQQTFYGEYHRHFEHSLDAHLAKWHELASAGAVSAAPGKRKIHPERLMQEGFALASPRLKAKRRKTDIIEVHGCRIVRSAGRKDRHSKVCTARGTRDRRVRLSPKTAIEFYDVQDRLGYDRPSKAIDWLMKEAKAAIDALDEPPPLAGNKQFTAAENHGSPQIMQQETDGVRVMSERGTIQTLKHLNDDSSSSTLGFFTSGAKPLSTNELQAYPSGDINALSEAPEDSMLHQEGLLSGIPSEMFEANLEMTRQQRIFAFVDSPPLHFPASPALGLNQMFSDGEPLQSRITNYSPNLNSQFSSIIFSNEEPPKFAAAATLTEDEIDKIPGSSKPSSSASCLNNPV